MGVFSPSDFAALLQALVTVARDLQTLLNPLGWVSAAFAACQDTLLGVFRDLLLGTGDAEDGSRLFIQSRTVTHFEPIAQLIADLALVVAVGYAGFRMMWAHSARNLYTVRLLLPRLMLGTVLINFALPLYQAAIDVNNALCATVLKAGQALDWSRLFSQFHFEGPGPAVLVMAALFLGYVVLALIYVVRYALLVILAITAPLAGLMFILHDTHHYAKAWGSLFITTLLMQPLQLLVLEVGFALEAEASLPIRHAFALAALFIAFKVPGALHESSSLGGRSFTMAKRHATHAAHAFLKAAA